MFAHQRKRVRLLYAIADAALTLVAFEAAYITRTHLTLERIFFLAPQTHALLAAVAALLWAALGSRRPVYGQRIVLQTFRQCLLGTGLLILYEYLLRLDLSRSFLLLFFPYELLLLLIFRSQASRFIGLLGSPYHLVLVGTGPYLSRLRSQLLHSPFRMTVTAELTPEECGYRVPELLRAHIVDEVIFTVPSETLRTLEPIFLRCDEEGVRTRVAVDFFPHINSEISLDRVGEASLLTFSAAPADELSLVMKRALDIAVAGFALLVLSPVMLVVALLIKLTSPGPVIYRQARCGLNGRRFTLLKFRSMVSNAEDLRAELEHLNERQVAFKLANDPRITPLGRLLRKYSIDEWPQFWNVLKGDMSLVGPRPPVPEEVDQYERWQKRRLRMRPGLTCLWVLMGRDRLDFNSWMRTDISYIDNWSLTLDWSILLKTIPHVLAGKGAH